MMTTDRRGFTIVELLVVAVLGTLLLMATYQILITNQQTYRANAEQVRRQQTLRIAGDVIASQLREVSSAGGDIVLTSTDVVRFLESQRFGLVCDIAYGPPPVLTVVQYGSFFQTGDSVYVLADNDEGINADDEWLFADVTAVDSTGVTCEGRTAQDLTFTGQQAMFDADSVRAGAPIRSFETMTVGHHSSLGEYVFRREGLGTREPMVGPISGVIYTYYDAAGNPTSTTADVRAISAAIVSENLADTMTIRVFPRN